jgi:arylsulfatase A-like enzyme
MSPVETARGIAMTLLRIALAVVALGCGSRLTAADPPNVLLVITDDQGFGDLGAHGNPVIKTPNLDKYAKQSAWLRNFYVSPVCSPTRSSLLTGFYNYRTGIVDTSTGRSMMRPDVPTLAEQLAAAGYRTGLFGKWHLGDNYPLRPEDRGFRETLWLHGGGLAQPSDPPEQDPKTAYFDPILTHNGKDVKTKGYCTDVFTDAAIKFLTVEPGKPFLAYVAYNCPHAPYQVPDELAAPYRKLDLTAAGFPKVGQPWATPKLGTEDIARAYGMIENIDTNFARLLKALDDAKLADNTIVLFLTDNGPGGVRFNAGLRNRKGTVYEGGIRVPCYVRWPGHIQPGHVVEQPSAHIDITPTLLAACPPRRQAEEPQPDGRDLLPLLTGDTIRWGDRTLFFQWHRGDAPEKYRAFAARGPRYKLVQAAGVQPGKEWSPKFELFDIEKDPFETKDLAADKPDVAADLKKQYEAWFADVTKKGFDPPRIVLGGDKENPVRLSRQDMRGPKAGWAPENEGYWEVRVEREGKYGITSLSRAEFKDTQVKVSPGLRGVVAERIEMARHDPKADVWRITQTIELEKGDARLSAWVEQDAGKRRGADYVEVKYLGPAK